MKSRFFQLINIVLVISTVGLVLFTAHFYTRAAPGDAVPQNDPATLCKEHIKAFAWGKKLELGKFMNQQFRSKKPTSDLIPAALQEYRIYKKDIRNELDRFFPATQVTQGPEGTQQTELAQAGTARDTCEAAMKEDLTLTKSLIRQFIVDNAYAKKSTRLLDKYKEINAKLDKLNFTIGQMYGYFGAFSQKMPCYATQCSKG